MTTQTKVNQSGTNLPESIILAQQTLQIYASVNNALIASFINASILVVVLWPVIDHGILLIWLAAISFVTLARGISAYQYKKAAPPPEKTPIWSRRFIIETWLAALVWGASAIWLFPVDDLARQVFLAFVIGGMAAAAVTNLSHIKLVVYPYLVFTLTPLLIQFFYREAELGVEMGFMITLYLVMLLLAANRNHTNIKQNICLHIESIERERSLQQSERRYETLLETATDAFFLYDLEGKLVDVNQQACRNLGYTRDELLNMSVSDIEIAPEQEMFKQQLWPKLDKGKNLHIEGIHRRKDGTTFPVDISLGLIQMGNDNLFSVLVRDITERKQAEEYIRNSQQRMALHVQSTPLGVIEWDKNFCVTEWNPAAETIFGFKKEEALGRHAKELIIPNDVIDHVDEIWKKLLALENGLRSTNENITRDGNVIVCEWYNTPLINETGEVIAVASLVQDITQQKNAEAALIQAKEEAENANQVKSKFLSNMSHELHTPMNAILGFSQILEFDDTLTQEQKGYVQEIINGGSHLLYLIDEMLDLSRIKTGVLELSLEDCSLNKILDESLSLLKPLATEYDIQLINDISSTSNFTLQVDHNRFKQVMLNLLSNAIKYNTAKGKVTLNCEVMDDNYLRINVIDVGDGLTEQEQQNLFKSFVRIGEYKGIDGVGLGLVISKNLIEKMGGKIGFESEEGKGSCFWVQVSMS